ncbi:hypothetical protein GCM10010306_021600 [Streptomyces umbrinus]|nr:hypothetical protein GCM10010306_021600 [Streptomyces umbrinus]
MSLVISLFRFIFAIFGASWAGLIRRIENARTPAPIWDDPSVVTRAGADDSQGSAARSGHRIPLVKRA